MSQRFKKMIVVKIILMWMNKLIRKHKNRLLTEYRLISTNKKVDYWLNIDWFRRTRKSTIDCYFRKLTIRQMKMKCNHRFQRKNFFINANSRSFSLIHDAHNENEIQSSFSKKKFRIDDFLLTRVFLRVIWRFFFWTFAYFYKRWKFCFDSFFLRAIDDFF